MNRKKRREVRTKMMSKIEKQEFETTQRNFKLACAANENMTVQYNKLVRERNNLEQENTNLKQQVENVTLERTALFQSLWDLQKLRKQQNAEIAQLKSHPQLTGLVMTFCAGEEPEAVQQDQQSNNE